MLQLQDESLPSQKQNAVIALGRAPLGVVCFKTAVSQLLLDLIKWIPPPIPRATFLLLLAELLPGLEADWK